jgi:hypothetical protein
MWGRLSSLPPGFCPAYPDLINRGPSGNSHLGASANAERKLGTGQKP